MYHPRPVCVVQPGQNLPGQLQRLLFGHGAAAHGLLQRPSVEQLHHQVEGAVGGLPEVGHPDAVGVIQLAAGEGLPLEAGLEAGQPGQVMVDDLHREAFIQARVAHLVNHSHGPLPQSAAHLIPPIDVAPDEPR